MSFKIAEKIKSLRKSKGLTQEQLANKAGLTKNYINKVETGVYESFRLNTLIDLADALEVHLSLLLFGKVLQPTRQLKQSGEFLVSLSKEEKAFLDKYRRITSKKEKLLLQDMLDTMITRKKQRKPA